MLYNFKVVVFETNLV